MRNKYKFDFITEKVKNNFNKNYTVDENECWVWQNYTNKDGYGEIHLKDEFNKDNRCRAHRISWMIEHESDWPIHKPVARHTCHNSSCVNPKHIIPGTIQENINDMYIAKRDRWSKAKQQKNFE